MKFYRFLLISILVAISIQAIEIIGTVNSRDSGNALIGANLNVLGKPEGAATDIFGNFTLNVEELPIRVEISHIGYKPDTFSITQAGYYNFQLIENIEETERIVVTETAKNQTTDGHGVTYGSNLMERKKVETSTLSGLLDGIAGMQMNICCGLHNTASLSLLGLPGEYTEITIDGSPEICGLASSYRLYSYPAVGVDRLSVNKGPSSARSQAKSLGGHVNLMTREPMPGPAQGSISVITRVVGGNELQSEITSKNGNIGTQFAVSYLKANPYDKDDDGWSESPARERHFTKFKLFFDDVLGIKSRISGLYIDEKIAGGMVDVDRIDYGQPPNWIMSVHTNRFESSFDLEIPLGYQSFLDFNTTGAFVGYDEIMADQQYIIDESGIISELGYSRPLFGGSFYSGVSYRYETIDDKAGILNRNDDRISLVAEETIAISDALTGNFGLRSDGDVNGDVNGDGRKWAVHPRMNLEYTPTHNFMTTLRLGSGGRFRPSVQDLMEGYDQAILIDIPPGLNRENGISANLGMEWKLFSGNSTFILTGMGYFTKIQERIIPYSETEGVISYINADGPTEIYGGEFGINALLPYELDAQIAFDFTQTSFSNQGIESELPFTPKYRAFGEFSWRNPIGLSGLRIFSTTMLYGPQKLPENAFGKEESEIFSTTSLDAAYEIGQFMFGLNISNIFNMKQELSPIQGTADPFATGVSSDLVYGPLIGTNYGLSLVYRFGGNAHDHSLEDSHQAESEHEHSEECNH
ncbi:MAG: TonB-dependent receptor domain-containing protein [Candidatus Zixiibacteriota bacterium]